MWKKVHVCDYTCIATETARHNVIRLATYFHKVTSWAWSNL